MHETIGVISLGCSKNLVDTERMMGLLAEKGYLFTNDPAAADILIVNTCGFIQPAKQEAINTLLEMARYKKKGGRCRMLVATGCLTERYGDELLKAMPEIDLVIGVHEYHLLPALLERRTPNESAKPLLCGSARVLCTPPYTAYLRISDGCDNRCAYCAIPLIRGGMVSEPLDALETEARRLADSGVTELTLIAQDTSCYGRDLYGEPKLIELLSRLSGIDALKWIRVLYTYPDTVTPELIDRIAESDKIVHYLDMPLQHASDHVLGLMNRRGSRAHIEMLMDHIAKHAPDFTLRTTMMVGFPGETQEDFESLLTFLRDHPFDRVGAFEFSPEDGTRAESMSPQVSAKTSRQRYDTLMQVQKKISAERLKRRIGTEAELLVERIDEEKGLMIGRTAAEAPEVDGIVRVKYRIKPEIGRYVPIRLTGAEEYDMTGEERI